MPRFGRMNYEPDAERFNAPAYRRENYEREHFGQPGTPARYFNATT